MEKICRIDALTISQNKLNKLHWSAVRGRGGYRDEWYWHVKLAIGTHNKPREEFCYVRIVRIAKRHLDQDNFIGGCKYLLDGLREFGHIKDDSTKCVKVIYEQKKPKRGDRDHMLIGLSYN